MTQALKVGELAKRTGLTIRTLHHYDEIGLLKPSLHTESGHRLYTNADVARLQQIVSLRQIGFTLEQVRDCLDRPGFSPLEVIRLHVARLREQMEKQRSLCARLEQLATSFGAAGEFSADDFIRTIEMMNMIENYYTPEQLEYFQKRREEMGSAAADAMTQQGTNDWAQLMADLTAEMKNGTDPSDPKLRVYEERRKALVSAFSGGNAGIENSLKRMWTEQGDKLAAQFGYDPKLMEYLAKVAEAHQA